MNLVGNIISKERSENISNSSILVKPKSDWHTGKPTEEGYYLCHFTDGYRTFDACFPYTKGAWDISGYGLNPYTFEVVAWQKIEPYEEGSE